MGRKESNQTKQKQKFLQRSKAQVDKTKLKEIEDEDRRLAQIIQEQEKLKLRKAKQKKKQQLEERRLQVRSLDKSGLLYQHFLKRSLIYSRISLI